MENKELTIIAAVSINNVIGNKNKLIWNIPNDFKNLISNISISKNRSAKIMQCFQ